MHFDRLPTHNSAICGTKFVHKTKIMTRKALLTATAAGFATALLTPQIPVQHVSGFQPTNTVPIRASVAARKRPLQTLYATGGGVATPPPRDEEKERKSNKDDHDWTAVEGGFLPNLLPVRKKAPAKKKEKKRSPKDLITNVETLQDYKAVVADETEKIVLVRFYAKWCRSCRAAEPQFHRLVQEYSDEDVKFVQVPLKRENAFLHEGLGVPSVPYCHIYHPEGGLVEEMKMNKKKFTKVRKSLEQYVNGSCDMADEPVPEDAEDDGDDGTPIGEFQ